MTVVTWYVAAFAWGFGCGVLAPWSWLIAGRADRAQAEIDRRQRAWRTTPQAP